MTLHAGHGPFRRRLSSHAMDVASAINGEGSSRPSRPCPPRAVNRPFSKLTRTHSSAVIAPSLPIARLVITAKSRWTPSSCDEEVRIFSGQFGQTSALFSFSGGAGMISSCTTEAAP